MVGLDPDQADVEISRLTVALMLAAFVLLVALVKACWPS
jgi:hypothetical protein